MQQATPTGGATRFLARQLLWTSLAGLQVGWLEVLGLESGGFFLARRDSLETAAVYGVLGALFGMLLAIAVLPVVLWARSRHSSASRLSRLALLASAVLPAFGVLWLFTAARVNVLHLPDVLSAPSLAANVALLGGCAAAALLWARRPWGAGVDAALLCALLAANLLGGAKLGVGSVPPRTGEGSAPAAAVRGARPDVVLILIDTLRADHLGAYGYERDTSPRIDAFAAKGVVFERAYSTTNWTRPAVASLFSSAMPSRHDVTALDRALGTDFELLAEALHRGGYQTGFFTVGPNIEPSDGYGRGVEHFFHGRSQTAVMRTVFVSSILLRLWPGAGRLLPGRAHTQQSMLTGDPQELTDRALEWVAEADRDRPLFMYLHYLGPHSPYRPPAPFDRAFGAGNVERLVDPPHQWAGAQALSAEDRRQMIEQYDGEILWHDHHIGRLLDGLRATGRLDDAVVAITADHGEGFGEHGVWGHNASLFEEVVRIPLILWKSDGSLGSGRREEPVSLLDVAPTLVEASGSAVPAGFDGVSVVASLRGARAGERPVFVENPLNEELGVRSRDWAYFEGRTGSGFDRWLYRADDRHQTEELSAEHPQVVEELRALAAARRDLDRSRGSDSVKVELDAERREMLEALGYVEEGGSPER